MSIFQGGEFAQAEQLWRSILAINPKHFGALHVLGVCRARQEADDEAYSIISQKKRKRIEEIFGWMKAVGGLRKSHFVGIVKTQLAAYMVGVAYNLLRMARLAPSMA